MANTSTPAIGFREIIEQRALDLLQPDIYRAGGLTELRKIAAMASAYHLR